MAEAGFLEQKRIRPGAVTVVALMHGAALAALLLAKPEFIRETFTSTEVTQIEIKEPPPPEPQPQREPVRQQRTTWTPTPNPPMPVPTPLPAPDQPLVPVPDLGSRAGSEDVGGLPNLPAADPPRPEPAPAPVRIDATMISGDLQPPYPASEQRAEREGSVVIRVTIGSNGRVIATEKVRATSDAFYETTERHARARWRFRPATVDGRPVEARKTLTVHFRLDES